MSEPTSTKLEPTLTSLRELSKAFPDSSRRAALLLDAADAIEGLEAENAKLRDENARLRSCQSDDADNARAIIGENEKLRELARLLLWGIDNDMPRYEELAWSQRVNALVGELGIEVDA